MTEAPRDPAPRERLLVLSQYYNPEPNFITADVAEAAQAAGYDVTVVTAHPNYPLGHLYPGRPWWRVSRAVERGVTVWRVPLYPYHGRSKVKRAISYLSFAAAAGVLAPFVGGRPRLVWIYQTPFTTALAALWFKAAWGSRVVFTCADLWPESFLAVGVSKPGLVMRLLFAYSRAINRLADLLICATSGTLERYAQDGIPRSRLRFVPVWVEGVPAGRPEPPPDADPARIVYAGNIGPAQSLETVVLAARELESRGARVLFEFYGTGSSEGELRVLASRIGVSNVRFHGRVPPASAFAVSASAQGQIVSLQRSALFRMTLPSKVSFCLAAGAPVLYGLEGEAAALLDESGGGVPFDPSDPVSLVQAVEELLGRSEEARLGMRARLRAFYEERFARDRLLEEYPRLFREVLS